MRKFKDGFSMRRAIVALAVVLFVATVFPVAIDSIRDNNSDQISASSENLFECLYKNYEQSNSAYAWTDWMHEPIVLDLDYDGKIEISDIKGGIYFDYNGDGFAEKMAWCMGGDGILVNDKNGNGKIDDASEIVHHQELANYDTNKDGVINEKDNDFSFLRIAKRNGKLTILEEEKVAEIKVAVKPAKYMDDNSNYKFGEGAFKKTDGKTYRFDEYYFMTDYSDTQEVDVTRVLPSVKKLPDIRCRGTVRSLHQAMMRDENLQKLVEKFVKEKNDKKRIELVTKIIDKWTENENAKSNVKTDNNVDPKHLAVVEAFMGHQFGVGVDGEVKIAEVDTYTGKQLESLYLKLENYVYAELMSQSHLSDLMKLIKTDKAGRADFTLVTKKLSREMMFSPKYGKQRVLEFARTVKGLGLDKNSNYLNPRDKECFYLKFTENDRELKWKIDSTAKVPLKMDVSQIIDGQLKGTIGDDAFRAKDNVKAPTNAVHSQQGEDVLYGSNGSDTLIGCEGDDILDGGDGDDLLISNAHNDIILGGDGNDRIFAGEDDDIIFGGDGDDEIYPDHMDADFLVNEKDRGNDIVVGGKGNDKIYSIVGDDTYIFFKGDGQDEITDKQGNDTLYFGKGIKWNDLIFGKVGEDMVIKIKNTKDQITVKGWFAKGQNGDDNNIIEVFEFADGSVHNANEIKLK